MRTFTKAPTCLFILFTVLATQNCTTSSCNQPPTTDKRFIENIEKFTARGRIAVIGDLHGDISATREALKLAGAIDDGDQWVGGTLVVVQTGDLLDRGSGEREILDLFAKLQVQAEKAGGLLVSLVGNHEIMNIAGKFSYVTEDGYKSFEDFAPTKKEGGLIDKKLGRKNAFRPGGHYATQLAKYGVIAKIDNSLFVHGGILPKHVLYGLSSINAEVQSWMLGQSSDNGRISEGSSPIWSRHYSDRPDKNDCALLDQVLELTGSDRLVVGHTIQDSGISPACNRRVWRIDVGMAEHFGGPIQVLEIGSQGVRVIKTVNGEGFDRPSK